jgi:hypothetical protein
MEMKIGGRKEMEIGGRQEMKEDMMITILKTETEMKYP